jgi:hypothetical protein
MILQTSHWSEYDLGEVFGGPFTTTQIYHLAGILFFALFGLSALRHGKRTGGWLPAVWGTVALGLFAIAFHIAVRGFRVYIPDEIIRYSTPDSLARVGAVLALVLWGAVFLSAHWVNGSLAKWWHRLGGLALLGVAVWLASGWFADEIPDEAKPWTARTIIVRIGTLASLILLAAAFWTRGTWASDHTRWVNRALTPMALVGAVFLGVQWFGYPANEYLTLEEFQRLLILLGTVASATCLTIAGGAWLMRTRPVQPTTSAPSGANLYPTSNPPPAKASTKPLPVALLLDSHGRPIAPRD